MNDQLQTQLAEILKAMKQGAEQYGPQTLEVAIRIKQVDSITEIVHGLIGLLILLAVVWVVKRQYRPAPRTPENLARISHLKDMGYGRRSIAQDRELERLTGEFTLIEHPEWLFAVFPLTFAGLFAIKLLNVWNWVGLFQPQLALAHDLFVKLTSR